MSTLDISERNPVPGESTFVPSAGTLHELLGQRAALVGDRTAYTYTANEGNQTISFSRLDQRAKAIGAHLQKIVSPGDRVLLLFPAGLEFITAFFGCLYAGVRAVPSTYPKPRRPMPRLTSIAEDCGATAALSDSSSLETMDQSIRESQLPELKWVAVDEIDDVEAEQLQPCGATASDIAFLQYTSGSTSTPKGVMVSHGNLLHNLEMIRQGFGLRPLSQDGPIHKGVFWLPAYHDMGLIGGILESLYVGGHSLLLSPAAFLQRPMRWLEEMSSQQADVSGAPNFAYELCVAKSTEEQRKKLDLSHWKVAFCGAEPIRPETFERFSAAFATSGFSPNIYYPCYGLAEGTLLSAGPQGPGELHLVNVCRDALAQHRVEFVDAAEERAQTLATCGGPHLGQRIVIADPDTRAQLPADRIGEIWVHGESIAQGYWQRPEDTKETFEAHLSDSNEGPFLRTGDLGFLVDGHLAITGRVKDVIIIRGRNHYPQDIENTVASAHEALRPDSGAVFTIDQDGEERLTAVHEVDRQYRNADFDEVIRNVRRAIAERHELEVARVVLIRHMNLPKTTSGKPQRRLCRQRLADNDLKVLADWEKSERNVAPAVAQSDSGNASTPREKPMTPDEVDRLAERIESWLLNWLVERAAIPQEEVDRAKPFAEYGLENRMTLFKT